MEHVPFMSQARHRQPVFCPKCLRYVAAFTFRQIGIRRSKGIQYPCAHCGWIDPITEDERGQTPVGP